MSKETFTFVGIPESMAGRDSGSVTWPCNATSSRSSAPRRSCGAFGAQPRLGVVEIAGELGLPKGTVHGLLRTLQQVGFVEQDADSGKYQLGAGAAAHGLQLPRRQRAPNPGPELVRLARRAHQRGGPDRHPARASGADRPSCVPPRRQPADARRRFAAAGCTQPRWARSCWRTTPTSPPSWSRTGLPAYTDATITRPAAARTRARTRARAGLGGRHRRARRTARSRSRPRSSTGAG